MIKKGGKMNLIKRIPLHLLRARLAEMKRITEVEGREAGFLVYFLPDRDLIKINEVAVGEINKMHSHFPGLGKNYAYPQGMGFYEEEGSQIIIQAHSHPSLSPGRPGPSISDLATLWEFLCQNKALAEAGALLYWVNPLGIVYENGYILYQFRIDLKYLYRFPDFIQLLRGEKFFYPRFTLTGGMWGIHARLRDTGTGTKLWIKKFKTLDDLFLPQKIQWFIPVSPKSEAEEE
jgi:hypothetical protein